MVLNQHYNAWSDMHSRAPMIQFQSQSALLQCVKLAIRVVHECVHHCEVEDIQIVAVLLKGRLILLNPSTVRLVVEASLTPPGGE